MAGLSHIQRDTVAALKSFQLRLAPGTVRMSGSGITFDFLEPDDAIGILGDRALFAQGPLGILHSRAVGGVVTEYRSYRRGESRSLHVVIGNSNRVFADLDRFNPYQNPLELFKHGFLELMPHLFRVALGRAAS
jgi:hypothetical protein